MQRAELLRGLGRGTRLIAESGALTSPFILVDIGARDGIHPRWDPLIPILDVYGYDASVQVETANPRHRYVMAAIGERDGEACIELHNGYEAKISSNGSLRVPMHKLDSLHSRGELPSADFIKIDCEGYEPEILRGAERYLAASFLIGVEVETSFNVYSNAPESHFVEMFKVLNRHGLFVPDFVFESATGKSALCWPGTSNALFIRRLTQETPVDVLLKTIAVCDVYGLYAQARALIDGHREMLAPHLHVAKLYSAVCPSTASVLAREMELSVPRLVPHIGLGLWSTARRLIDRIF